MIQKPFVSFLIGILILPFFSYVVPYAFAQSISEIDRLQQDIADRGSRLAEIEKEIAKFEADLKVVGAEKQTLQKAINQIESAIAEIIRTQYREGEGTMVELLLNHNQLSDFWSTFEAHETVRDSMSFKVAELSSMQRHLDDKREENTDKRSELVSLQSQYKDQNNVLSSNQEEQSDLLAVTKNEEQNYQRLLAEKQEARDQIIKDLRDFEAKLQFILDPNTIPTAGTAVFAWPLKNVTVTQWFGGSEFAKRNPGIYGGRAYHPGIDMGTPRGTSIHAPLSGTVRATGNTDLVPGCYSWGKWTLIDHANGLSTLYAHQDVISVTPGQKVTTGEIIGYSGNTGYSTGPHLHFTVYVKDGVTVRQFNEIKTVTSCGPATTPVAATDAYVDPSLYLPPL